MLDELTKVGPNYSEADLQSITVPVLILDGAEDEFDDARPATDNGLADPQGHAGDNARDPP